VALWAVLAFVSFSLSASAMYVLNDLLDLETDRHHRSKRMRPLACGDLSIPAGALIVPILLLAGLGLAEYVGHAFAGVLAIYLGLTAGYSWGLKKVPILDVFCLAGLYTIRLVAGHEAARINYSFWLLVFSMFIFLSLALVKRFQEIDVAQQKGRDEIRGRGYAPSDRELVASLGAISGYMSALVLALYVNSHEVQVLYHHPMLLLLVCPLLLYWISRVWFIAHRGLMHEDPIVFALRDKVSYAIGGLTLLVLWLATGR
jgi:4-hydroxybenzoate polyprenyltransferase